MMSMELCFVRSSDCVDVWFLVCDQQDIIFVHHSYINVLVVLFKNDPSGPTTVSNQYPFAHSNIMLFWTHCVYLGPSWFGSCRCAVIVGQYYTCFCFHQSKMHVGHQHSIFEWFDC